MTTPLSWNLHGNDQLSSVLEKLDRTVSKLARSMNDGSSEAREYGRSLSSVEGPATRFHGNLQTTSGHLDGLTSKFLTLGTVVKGVLVGTVLVGLARAGEQAAEFGIKMAAANESAAISFELMLGSADKAQEFLGQLLKFAAATPFEMPQLRSAASRLLAVGVSAERVIPILTVLGDATAGMGTGAEGIERAVTALTQMQQKTKVTGEEMMQLTEAGIPAWETLASKLGVDVATAMDMVTKREVDAGVIFDAVQERQGAGLNRLTGMMTRQSTTLTGLWSTFKDNAGQALAQFAEPAIPGIKKVLDFAAGAIPTVLDGIRGMSSQIMGIFAGSDVPERIMNSLRDLGERILPVLKDSWDKIVKVVSDNKEGLEKLGRFIADIAIPLLGDGLVHAIDGVTRMLAGIIWTAAHVVDAIKWMTEAFLTNLGMIIHGADAAFGWIPGLGPKLHEATAAFDAFAQGVMDKLNALDGKTVDVWINTHDRGVVGEHGGSGVGSGSTSTGVSMATHHDSYDVGGWVPGPTGTPRPAIVHGGEYVETAAEASAMRGGGGNGIIGMLVVRHETPDGHLIREELLALKRQRNLASLGF